MPGVIWGLEQAVSASERRQISTGAPCGAETQEETWLATFSAPENPDSVSSAAVRQNWV